MTLQQLIPCGGNAAPHWLLQARLMRLSQSSLALNYELEAPAAEVIWPAASNTPQRCDELWHSTCLELFIATPGGEPYWEINLSPSGDWNAYQLDGYRQGLQPELSIERISIQSQSGAEHHLLHAILELPRALIKAQSLQANLCAVLKHANHSNSYWAVCHPGSRPDFHARGGFVLEL